MAINYALLRNTDTRKVISALERDGFALDRQTGSHRLYRHPDGRRVTVSFHGPGQTFTRKTLRSMIEEQARWTEDDLKRLKLLSK